MRAEDTLSAQVLERLRRESAEDDRLVYTHTIPAREQRCEDWPDWVPVAVRDAYCARGVKRPWKHQIEAAQSVWRGSHTVVATGTGSGKSLAAWLPILSALTANAAQPSTKVSQLHRRPTALYVAPTKALAADQLSGLLRVIDGAATRLPVQAGVCDGDASREVKQWARGHADIVISNPDYVHHVMLPGHQRWVRLLRSLQFLIVDEVHSYRGVAGAHMALVLRRLLRVARHYGANPTVIALSATVAQPQQLLARILGVNPYQVVAVDDDTSPAGAHHLVLWQPLMVNPGVDRDAQPHSDGDDVAFSLTGVSGTEDDGLGIVPQHASSGSTVNGATAGDNEVGVPPGQMAGGLEFQRRSLNTEAAWVTALAVTEGAKALTFVRSRVGSEQVAKIARRMVRASQPELADTVAAYRGGFLPEERRELEQLIRRGELRALATTNALEMGVDITGLDVTVTAGWPGTRASLWQQTGRAGRAGVGGLSIFVASENPLDTYLIHHPDALFDPVEQSTFDPSNPYVLGPHVCAAAAELPLTDTDLQIFGLPDDTVLRQLAQRKLLVRRPAGWYWNATLPWQAHDMADLRGMGGQVQVVEHETGRVIGSVDQSSAHQLVHPGAIYTHQSAAYEVLSLTDDIAVVRRWTKALTTRPTQVHDVQVRAEHCSWRSSDDLVTWHWGETNVTTQVTDYDILRLPTLQFVGNKRLDLSPRILETKSMWFTLDPVVASMIEADEATLPGVLHATEHAMIGMLPLLAVCDRWDLGGLSTTDHSQTRVPTVFVHDAVAGGAGFSETGYLTARTWVTRTLEAVMSCPCDTGCPACIQSPKCGNNNDPLDKAGAIRLLRFLSTRSPQNPSPQQ